jgi:predicted AAA+ superfamily ATPase
MDNTPEVLFPRFAAELVTTALQDTPVVMVTGPRQSGKTTLVRNLVPGSRQFITLDDDTVLAAARSDPVGLVRDLDRTTIDEIQRAPDLLRAIKGSVDKDRRAGRFLLTGSANLLTLPKVSESLAGRMEIVDLFPLSRSEVLGKQPTFLKMAFESKLSKPAEIMFGKDLVETVLVGGYPEMLRRADARRRQAWARDYIRAILLRDVREVADVEKLDQMPRLLQSLAHQSGQLVNFTQLGSAIGFDDKTTRKYVAILEQLFLVRRLQPWFRNRLKRLVKSPKLHFVDSGLLAALQGATAERTERERSILGTLLETYVFGEVWKQASWLGEGCALYHFRDKDQDEVDIVIENGAGAVVGVEVKAAATVSTKDFKGLRKLAEACGADFKLGIVLYDGESAVPFGDGLFAAPLPCLWG